MAYPAPQQAPPPQTQWQPPPDASAAPAPAPKKKTGMIIGVVVAIVVVVVILVVVLMMGGKTVTMTPAEFNAAATDDFPTLNSGDTLIVKGNDIGAIISNPLTAGSSIITVDGTLLALPVTLPSSCAVGTSFTATLHVTTISYGGANTKWLREFGTTYSTAVSVPASAIVCA